ncbi:hypothetical protein [Lysobacter sp. 1R34A]|uniref:hypothetical protein n=1 Tax=Lysobacter sp. 1R34A TaxID=3445786 RepID=UPI003EEDE0C9
MTFVTNRGRAGAFRRQRRCSCLAIARLVSRPKRRRKAAVVRCAMAAGAPLVGARAPSIGFALSLRTATAITLSDRDVAIASTLVPPSAHRACNPGYDRGITVSKPIHGAAFDALTAAFPSSPPIAR